MVRCQYANREIKIHDCANREYTTACADYGLLTHISEIKKKLDIDTGIVPNIVALKMQKHDVRRNFWAHALAMYVFF